MITSLLHHQSITSNKTPFQILNNPDIFSNEHDAFSYIDFITKWRQQNVLSTLNHVCCFKSNKSHLKLMFDQRKQVKLHVHINLYLRKQQFQAFVFFIGVKLTTLNVRYFLSLSK